MILTLKIKKMRIYELVLLNIQIFGALTIFWSAATLDCPTVYTIQKQFVHSLRLHSLHTNRQTNTLLFGPFDVTTSPIKPFIYSIFTPL